MHEKNLYQVSNLYDPVFVDLVDLVKTQARVPTTRNWEQKVPDKCRELINTSTRTWKRDGLLITRNHLTRKTDIFQYLWKCATQAAQPSSSATQSFNRDFDQLHSITRARRDSEDGHSKKVLSCRPSKKK